MFKVPFSRALFDPQNRALCLTFLSYPFTSNKLPPRWGFWWTWLLKGSSGEKWWWWLKSLISCRNEVWYRSEWSKWSNKAPRIKKVLSDHFVRGSKEVEDWGSKEVVLGVKRGATPLTPLSPNRGSKGVAHWGAPPPFTPRRHLFNFWGIFDHFDCSELYQTSFLDGRRLLSNDHIFPFNSGPDYCALHWSKAHGSDHSWQKSKLSWW